MTLVNAFGAIALDATVREVKFAIESLPQNQPVTNAELRASAIDVAVENQITGFATEASLAALNAKVPALSGGKIPVDVTFPASQTVSGPLTDTQLRASDVDVSVTNQITGYSTEATLQKIRGGLTHGPVTLDATMSPAPSALRFDAAGTVIIEDSLGHQETYTVSAGELFVFAVAKVVTGGTVAASDIKAWYN